MPTGSKGQGKEWGSEWVRREELHLCQNLETLTSQVRNKTPERQEEAKPDYKLTVEHV